MVIINFSKRTGLSDWDYLIVNVDVWQDDLISSKKLISFALIQIFKDNQKTIQVIKYDSSHRFVHLHKFFNKKEVVEIIDLPVSFETFSKLEGDIKDNWFKYKKWFLQNKDL